jgi:hypothetical protein
MNMINVKLPIVLSNNYSRGYGYFKPLIKTILKAYIYRYFSFKFYINQMHVHSTSKR